MLTKEELANRQPDQRKVERCSDIYDCDGHRMPIGGWEYTNYDEEQIKRKVQCDVCGRIFWEIFDFYKIQETEPQ